MNHDIAILSIGLTIVLMILSHAGPVPNNTTASEEVGNFIVGFILCFFILKLGYLILN